MAEKRGKDRVIIRLLNLHGEGFYSEEEADDFKASKPSDMSAPPMEAPKKISSAKLTASGRWPAVQERVARFTSPDHYGDFVAYMHEVAEEVQTWPDRWSGEANDLFTEKKAELKAMQQLEPPQ
jgi:hypothetical protein